MEKSELKEIEIAIEGSKHELNSIVEDREGILSTGETLRVSMELDELINQYIRITENYYYDDVFNQ